jgi:hypothetical protein
MRPGFGWGHSENRMSEAAENKIGGALPSDKKSPIDVAQDGEKFVTAISPRAFTLTLDDHTKVEVQAGTQELPESIANHWYSKAHGVSVYAPMAAKKEDLAQSDESGDSNTDSSSNSSAEIVEKRRPGRPAKAQ